MIERKTKEQREAERQAAEDQAQKKWDEIKKSQETKLEELFGASFNQIIVNNRAGVRG